MSRMKTLNVAGMSLIEFLTVISIIIVITSIATPFLGALISRYQAESAGYHILATLKFCRVEALKRENDVHCNVKESAANNTILTTVFLDDNNSNIYEKNQDTLLSQSTISNTTFLQITPIDTSWIYNRQGVSSNIKIEKLQLCSKKMGRLNLLNTIFIDPLGVTYMRGAAKNAACT